MCIKCPLCSITSTFGNCQVVMHTDACDAHHSIHTLNVTLDIAIHFFGVIRNFTDCQ